MCKKEIEFNIPYTIQIKNIILDFSVYQPYVGMYMYISCMPMAMISWLARLYYSCVQNVTLDIEYCKEPT